MAVAAVPVRSLLYSEVVVLPAAIHPLFSMIGRSDSLVLAPRNSLWLLMATVALVDTCLFNWKNRLHKVFWFVKWEMCIIHGFVHNFV